MWQFLTCSDRLAAGWAGLAWAGLVSWPLWVFGCWWHGCYGSVGELSLSTYIYIYIYMRALTEAAEDDMHEVVGVQHTFRDLSLSAS